LRKSVISWFILFDSSNCYLIKDTKFFGSVFYSGDLGNKKNDDLVYKTGVADGI
jgi:hypothetical protein